MKNRFLISFNILSQPILFAALPAILSLSILVGVSGITVRAQAQTAAVKDIPADSDTTITVSKGKKSQTEYEVTDGTADVQGEPEVLARDARTAWRKACTEWKQELKELNKDNQVLSMNCGTPKCEKNSNMEFLCESKASYKVKTRIR